MMRAAQQAAKRNDALKALQAAAWRGDAAGVDKTCERRAQSVCGCDPVTHPKCGGKWESLNEDGRGYAVAGWL